MTVNNVNALLNFKTSQTAGQTEQAGAKQEELVKGSFDKIMTKVNDTLKSLHADAAGTTAAVSGDTTVNTLKKDAEVQNTGHREAGSANRTDDSGKTEDTMQQEKDTTIRHTDETAETDNDAEEVKKAAEELVKDIAEEMDVTPEEVEEAMAVLGLTAVELFDIGNLKQLLLQISGNTDELSLVTNETLYGNLQNLFTVVEESLVNLQEELGLSEEELNALVEQMISENGKSEVLGEALAQDTPEVNLEGMKDYTVSVQKDGETVQVKVTVDDASGNKSVQEEVTDTSKPEAQDMRRMQTKDASADSGRGEGNAADNAAGNPLLQMPDKALETVETPTPLSAGYQSMQTEDIMNQIMDYMKINLKADSQQMELQLHPASLGTVNVQIASKDGAITAQFTTQNEAVRAVIETQLIQLKEQFEEQGIKVDAVEVTVASHEYGQQFSQGDADANQKQGKSAKSTRKINLDEIDEDDELVEMEESERIAVEMMKANGNTVDYTA